MTSQNDIAYNIQSITKKKKEKKKRKQNKVGTIDLLKIRQLTT